MTATNSTFRAAIPGMSLTREMGSLPSDRPPEYTDANEAAEYFWKQFHRPEILKQIWMIAENGADARRIAVAVLYKAAMMGIIQMNLGIVLFPIVTQMVYTLCKSNGIDIKLIPKQRDKVKDAMMQKKINDKLGRKHNPPIPPSAMAAMIIPKAKDITKAHEDFLKMNIPAAAPKTPVTPQDQASATNAGLLARAGTMSPQDQDQDQQQGNS